MSTTTLTILIIVVSIFCSLFIITNAHNGSKTQPVPTISEAQASFYEQNIDMSNFDLEETNELPVLFLSHAAPVLIMKESDGIMGRKNDAHFHSEIANWYRSIPKMMNLIGENKPKAIVQFSAHYETPNGPIKILASDTYKSLLYDYYGFPGYTYDVKYPAPGNSKLAKRIKDILTTNGIPATLDFERGIDHGGFIPLMLMYPEADIPVLQISVCGNAAVNRKIGELLAPLRKQGVLFTGSGQATHGAFNPKREDIRQQEEFVKAFTAELVPSDWSNESKTESYTNVAVNLTNDQIYEKRAATVDNWAKFPGARYAHPHWDHYMPLPGCVGTTKGGANQEIHVIGDHWLVGIHSLRSFVFGEYPFKQLNKDIAVIPAITQTETLVTKTDQNIKDEL